jgi:hypothetical protein
MQPSDDRILEALREHGNLNPAAFEEFGVTSASHASNRLRLLHRSPLVEQLAPSLYRLTDTGRAYLIEEFDASDLPHPDPGD